MNVGATAIGVSLTNGGSLTLDGNGDTRDGAGAYRGLFVYSGAMTVENRTIVDAVAPGGDLFIQGATDVTLAPSRAKRVRSAVAPLTPATTARSLSAAAGC